VKATRVVVSLLSLGILFGFACSSGENPRGSKVAEDNEPTWRTVATHLDSLNRAQTELKRKLTSRESHQNEGEQGKGKPRADRK